MTEFCRFFRRNCFWQLEHSALLVVTKLKTRNKIFYYFSCKSYNLINIMLRSHQVKAKSEHDIAWMDTCKLHRTICNKRKRKQFHLNGLQSHSSKSKDDVAFAFAFDFAWCEQTIRWWKPSKVVALSWSYTVKVHSHWYNTNAKNFEAPIGIFTVHKTTVHIKKTFKEF